MWFGHPETSTFFPGESDSVLVKGDGDDTLNEVKSQCIMAIYNDLSRGHPKWWFSKGIPPKMALNQVKDL